jgi:hypothetical protein
MALIEHTVPILYSEIFGRKPTWYDLRDHLKRLPLAEVVRRLSGFNHVLHNATVAHDSNFQRQILSMFSSIDHYRNKIDEHLDSRYFIFPEQLAVAQRYALSFCEAATWPDRGDDHLAKALLITAELRASEFKSQGGDASDFMSLELAGMFGFHDPITHNLYRTDQFFKWARSEKGKPDHVPVEDDFIRFTGMRWEDYRASGYIFWAYFRQFNSVGALSRVDALLDGTTWIADFGGPPFVTDWLSRCSWVIDEVIRALGSGEPSHFGGAWLYPLRNRPLIQLPCGLTCCPHLPFLENTITVGMLYLLADAYFSEDPKKSSNLRALYGRFFEDYVHQLFDRVSSAQTLRCFGELKYGRDKKSSDVAIFSDEEAMFVEVVSSRFKQVDTLVLQDPAAVDEDIDRVVAKVRQLRDRIDDFRAGLISYAGVLHGKIKRITPIVVIGYSLPQFLGLRTLINQKLAARDIVLSPGPRFVEINALELLEQDLTSGVGLFNLIMRWQTHPVGSRFSLINFTFFFGGEVGLRTILTIPPDIEALRREIVAQINSWLGRRKITP